VQRTITGYAARFGSLSVPLTTPAGLRYRERIAPGAFTKSLRQGSNVVATLEHDAGSILGQTGDGTLRLEQDALGLRYEIDLADTWTGRGLATRMEAGEPFAASFAFSAAAEQWPADERAFDGLPVRILTAVELVDIAVVRRGAYRATDATLRTGDDPTLIPRLRLKILDLMEQQ
jgi:HK97 family phage prohead protease